MPDTTWNDFVNAYNDAISERNDGGFLSDDFEVQGALNAAVTAMTGVAVAATRARARRSIADAEDRIKNAQAFLKLNGENSP